jgi:hypothetical protein
VYQKTYIIKEEKIGNNLKVINRRMDKQIVVYSSNGIYDDKYE